MRNFVFELLGQRKNTRLSSLSFSFRAFDLDFSIIDSDVDIEFLTVLVDAFTLPTNEVICEFLRKVEGCDMATLRFISLLGFYEGCNLFNPSA